MRIGVVTPVYHGAGGGDPVPVAYARGLRARGYDVVVLAGSVLAGDGDDGIELARVRTPAGSDSARALAFPAAATRALARHGLDNVVAFGSTVTVPAVLRVPGCHRSWWEIATRAWPVWSADGLRRRIDPRHRVLLGWDRRVLGGGIPTAVLAAGHWAAEEIRRFYPAVEGKVGVLPDGLDLDRFGFDEAGRGLLRAAWDVGDRPALFILATELRRKGVGTSFEAFRRVLDRTPDAVMVVGGRVPPEHLRALAVQHRITPSVRVIGFVPDVRAAYSAADLLLFPTRFDPWGLPVAEALACGTRVAVSARAGASSLVVPGVNGEVIENPADPASVANAIVRAMAIPIDREAARASVHGCAWDRVVDGLVSVLERTARTA